MVAMIRALSRKWTEPRVLTVRDSQGSRSGELSATSVTGNPSQEATESSWGDMFMQGGGAIIPRKLVGPYIPNPKPSARGCGASGLGKGVGPLKQSLIESPRRCLSLSGPLTEKPRAPKP